MLDSNSSMLFNEDSQVQWEGRASLCDVGREVQGIFGKPKFGAGLEHNV